MKHFLRLLVVAFVLQLCTEASPIALATSKGPLNTTTRIPTSASSKAPANTTIASTTTTDQQKSTTDAPTTAIKPNSTTTDALETTTTQRIETTTKRIYDCSMGAGQYPSPYSCSQFYVCVQTYIPAYVFDCPANLWYDPKLQQCNYPELVDCDIRN